MIPMNGMQLWMRLEMTAMTFGIGVKVISGGRKAHWKESFLFAHAAGTIQPDTGRILVLFDSMRWLDTGRCWSLYVQILMSLRQAGKCSSGLARN